MKKIRFLCYESLWVEVFVLTYYYDEYGIVDELNPKYMYQLLKALNHIERVNVWLFIEDFIF